MTNRGAEASTGIHAGLPAWGHDLPLFGGDRSDGGSSPAEDCGMSESFSDATECRTLRTELWLPRSVDEVFGFFADAHNLERITPPWLGFRILTPAPIDMYEGTLIDYRIKLHGVPMRWRTRIDAWVPPFRFVDMQLRGPYTHWRHEHTFEALDGGTLCRDFVEYSHLGGGLVHRMFVRPELEKIFGYRQRMLRRIFIEGADGGGVVTGGVLMGAGIG